MLFLYDIENISSTKIKLERFSWMLEWVYLVKLSKINSFYIIWLFFLTKFAPFFTGYVYIKACIVEIIWRFPILHPRLSNMYSICFRHATFKYSKFVNRHPFKI